jgi:stage V sporulation protein G
MFNKRSSAMSNKKAAEKEASSAFDCLAVTQVQVYPFQQGPSMGHLLGLATVVLNDQFQVRGLRIMDGENGLYVGYPNDPFYKGEDFRSVCCPMTKQLREHIENCVLEKYSASADPKEWVVEFKNGDEMSIKMEVSEFTRADAIVLAKGKIEAKYGKKVADGLELVSATEK